MEDVWVKTRGSQVEGRRAVGGHAKPDETTQKLPNLMRQQGGAATCVFTGHHHRRECAVPHAEEEGDENGKYHSASCMCACKCHRGR